MSYLLDISQVIVSLLLVTAILLQQRGGGLSPVFGMEGGGVYRTRRGIEKMIFWATIILSVLFLLVASLNLFLY